MHAIYIPNYGSGKGILILHSYKDLASQHFQCDPRWYNCNHLINMLMMPSALVPILLMLLCGQLQHRAQKQQEEPEI